MNQSIIPIIEVQVRAMGQVIQNAMMTHADDINAMVKSACDRLLTAEHIQHKIDSAVQDAINGAIANLAKDYRVQDAAANLVASCLERAAQEI